MYIVQCICTCTSTCVCIACWNEHTCYHCADATIYVGGLDEKVTEALLWELFLQAGPVGMLQIPSLLHYFVVSMHTYYYIVQNVLPAVKPDSENQKLIVQLILYSRCVFRDYT